MSVRLASMEKISFLLDESISKCTAVSICILLQFHGPVASKLVTFNPSLRQIICKVFALKISCTLRYSFDNTEQYFNNQLKYMCYELQGRGENRQFSKFMVFARPSRKVVDFVNFIVFAR